MLPSADLEPHEAPPVESFGLAAEPGPAARVARRADVRRIRGPTRAQPRPGVPRRRTRPARTARPRPRPGRPPDQRGRGRPGPRLVHRRPDRGGPLRRRLVGGGRRRAPRRRRVRRGGQPRPRVDEPGAGDRPDQPGGAGPGGSTRAAPGGAAQAAAGTRCGSSRSPSSSRRSAAGSRPGRAATSPPCSPTSTTSRSRCGSSPPPAWSSPAGSRLGGRPVTRPDVPRLRGVARRDHAGVDAPAGPTPLAGRGLGGFADYDAGVRAVRALSQSGLHPANCRLLDPVEALINAGLGDRRTRPRLRVRRPSGSPRGWSAPWSCAATTAARCPSPPATPTRPTSPPAAAPATAGGRRSCGCPTSATRSPRAGMIVETFETACTWDRFATLVRGRRTTPPRTRCARSAPKAW